MRILYVTRKYPPSTGGMERAAYELHQALAANNDVQLVKWGGSNRLLPIVYVGLLVRALFDGIRRRPDIIYLQDGLLAPLGWILKHLLRVPTVMTIHGLEATYSNPLYRVMVTPFIHRQSQLVAVGNETKQKVVQALSGSNPVVIHNGIADDFYSAKPRSEQLQLIAQEFNLSEERLRTSKLLYTNGRLVQRKGVLWFVETVLPLLEREQSMLYVVSGSGKDQAAIAAAAKKHALSEQVLLVGKIRDTLRNALYNAADIFVMPNIPVAGDMEGFGLVALEAASCGTTVIASQLEGIQDAIIPGKNGWLVPAENVAAYTDLIRRELRGPSLQASDIRRYTLEHFSWDDTARQYQTLLEETAQMYGLKAGER